MRNGHVSMVRKRYLLQAVIGSFLCSFATASASEPTLRETIDFINRMRLGCSFKVSSQTPDQTTENTTTYYGGGITLQDDNTIVVTTTVISSTEQHLKYFKVDRKSRWTEVQTVCLSDLSPKDTTVRKDIYRGALAIHVSCTKDACINTTRKDTSSTSGESPKAILNNPRDRQGMRRYLRGYVSLGTRSSPDTSFSSSAETLFCTMNEKDAGRVQKALTHAIRLSGGKDQLF